MDKRKHGAALLLSMTFLFGCGESETSDETTPDEETEEVVDMGLPDMVEQEAQDTSEADISEADTTEEPDVAAESFIEGRVCPPDSFLTWENFGEGILLDNCTGCHSELLAPGQRAGAPEDVDFNTPEQVQTWLMRIYLRSADDNRTMPPADTLTAQERTLLGDWLACGAP